MVINNMRRAGAVLWLALAFVQFTPAVTIDADDVRVHAEALRNTYPRPEGSAGERAALQYIYSVLDSAGVTYGVRDFSDFDEGHSFSRIVDVGIPGESAQTILIAVPLGHAVEAGPDEDGSASLAAVLAVIQAVARDTPKSSFRFLILGAEQGKGQPYPMGTRLFLRDFFPNATTAAIYLAANQSGLILNTGGGGEVAPSWLVSSSVASAHAAGIVPRVRAGLNQLHRMGISSAPEPLVQFLSAGIPTVHIGSETGLFEPESVTDSATAISVFLTEFIDRLDSGIPAEWDRHYLYFVLGNRQVIVPEHIYLALLLGVVLSTLLYALIARTRLVRYLRAIVRNAWNLPVLFLLIFAFLSAGTYLLELFLLIRRFPTLWEHSPMAYVALKITLSLLLFSVAAQFLRHLPLSKNGSFYSAAALFVLFVDVILFSTLNLSFSYYFVWAFLFAFLFSVLRRRALKLATLIASPFLLLAVAVQVLAVPELRAAQVLLLSLRGNLVLSFVTLPFLLMLIRLDFLIRHPVAGRRSFALRVVTLGSGSIAVALLVYILVSVPYSPTSPQPIQVVERVDYESFTRSLIVTSPAPLGEFTLDYLGEEHLISTTARTWETSADRIPDILSVRLSTADFLDRNQARLLIDSPLSLERVSVRFTAAEPMTIYDAQFPYRLSADRLSARIFIGAQPPLPLIINYTTTRDTNPRIEVLATSRDVPDEIAIRKERAVASKSIEIRTVLNP